VFVCSINAVLRSLALTPADCVFMLDIAYGSVKKLATHVTATCAATVVTTTVRVSALTSSDDIVRIVAESLPANAKLAIFDHVTSNTGIVLPVAELTAVCHARGTRVLIDGAHALGMLDLNIASVGADYYVR
jgi:isopenicillin-N epimerase